MSEQLSTPRITAAYLDNFVGKVVMLVGKVTQLRGEQATLDSEGTVTVLLNRDAHLTNGNAVQVIGKVNPDLSIKVLTSRDLGTGVDFGLYSSVVQATHKHPSIFAYTPRVAMVWTSPTKAGAVTSPPRQRQAYSADQDGKSIAIPDSVSTRTIRSSKPLHSAAQRLQRHTHSIHGQTRPTTAMSFTTSSSDMILGRDIQSRSSTPLYPSGPSHISQTPTSSLGALLPSPPEDTVSRTYSVEMSRRSSVSTQPNQRYSNSQTYDQESTQESYIPSAQPYTPLAYSPPSMSSASLLPSPPMTQEDQYLSHGPLMFPASSTSSRRYSGADRRPAGVANRNSKLEDPEESALFDSILEGIGRVHVSMNRDDAGRWRIKRASDERP
ncbi:replication factor A protein 3-domain-containing protein [Fusarium sp. MPI-SDFR-AT-0072]|nr:replication factor A protein 3-domain-containing protein [Fusarium sp. MPI-SDFR-AT-0072]